MGAAEPIDAPGHDVAIAGASIAGAATAIHLARAGLRVLLVDRATFPRAKVCGEGLFPRGVAALDDLGVLPELAGEHAALEGVRFAAGPEEAVAPLGRGPYPAIGVRRTALDKALLDAARRAGVEVRLGVTVHGLAVRGGRVAAFRTSEGPLPARAFVAGDGLRSRLRRVAGLERVRPAARYGVSAHVRLASAPPPCVDVRFCDGHDVYVTPVGGAEANVALLLRRPAMRRFAGRVESAYREALADNPLLAGGYELLDAPAAAGPFPAACTRAWRANLVLVGDAAGFYDGVSGEGMSLALQSAEAAAASLVRYLGSGDPVALRAYDRRRRALARNSDILARLTLMLASRPALARYAVRNLGRRPGTFARLVAINSGEQGLRHLRPRDLAALALGV